MPSIDETTVIRPGGAHAPQVLRSLNARGYAVAPGLVDGDAVAALRDESRTALDTLHAYEYPFGEQCRVSAADIDSRRFPTTAALLLDGAVAEVCDRYGADVERDLIVWSHEHRPDPAAIYGRPHFDRRHQLKVFVYLDDVAGSNGPTHVAVERPRDFRARWVRAWRSALALDAASDDEVIQAARETPEDSASYRAVECALDEDRSGFTPLTGPAGTVVFFDTSLAHYGGLVRDRASRRTVRRHCLLD